MICKKCNSTIPDDSIYCPKCGQHFPSFKRGKPTPDVNFIKKAFFSKEKEKPDNTEEPFDSKEKSADTKEEWVEVKPKKISIGWGWFLLAFIVYSGINKTYDHYGDARSLLFLAGIIISLLIYFYCRNKALNRISKLYIRSFISGVISLVITVAAIALISRFIPTDEKDDLITNVVEEIESSNALLEKELVEHNSLMADFNSEPETEFEIKNNILILIKLLKVNNIADSLTSFTYAKAYNVVTSYEKAHPEKTKENQFSSSLILTLIESANNTYDQKRITLQSLIDYYNALLNDDENQDELLENYVNEDEKLIVIEKEFLEVQNHFNEVINR